MSMILEEMSYRKWMNQGVVVTEEICLPDEGKGVAVPGNITEEEKYMEQKVAFVAYQVQFKTLVFLFFYFCI